MQITKNFVVKHKFVVLLELLVGQERRGVRRKSSAAKCAFDCASRPEIARVRFLAERDSRDAALRMTAGGIGRDFVAGFRANMPCGTIIVNIYQLILMQCYSNDVLFE